MFRQRFTRLPGRYRLALTGLCLWLLGAAPLFAGETIRIGGTGTALGVMKLLGAAYEKRYPTERVEVLPSLGSSGSIKAVIDGAIGLAIAGRPLNGEETKAGARGVEIARTPFVFVTNGKNSPQGITGAELVDIYGLKTTQWPGGEPIRLVLRPARETSSAILKAISPEMEKAMAVAMAREGMVFAATDQDSAAALTKIPGALGASTLTQVITEQLPLKILALDGVRPSVRGLADGSYRLYKPMVLVTTPRASAAVRGFAAFVQSAEARPILEQAGNLPGPFN